MLYRNIENSDDNRKVKQVVEEQEQNQFKSALFGETFADFAIFGFFVKVWLAKSSENCGSWKFTSLMSYHFSVCESLFSIFSFFVFFNLTTSKLTKFFKKVSSEKVEKVIFF